jgi:hypothetical protein
VGLIGMSAGNSSGVRVFLFRDAAKQKMPDHHEALMSGLNSSSSTMILRRLKSLMTVSSF